MERVIRKFEALSGLESASCRLSSSGFAGYAEEAQRTLTDLLTDSLERGDNLLLGDTPEADSVTINGIVCKTFENIYGRRVLTPCSQQVGRTK